MPSGKGTYTFGLAYSESPYMAGYAVLQVVQHLSANQFVTYCCDISVCVCVSVCVLCVCVSVCCWCKF